MGADRQVSDRDRFTASDANLRQAGHGPAAYGRSCVRYERRCVHLVPRMTLVDP
jgi:hypothetical protein